MINEYKSFAREAMSLKFFERWAALYDGYSTMSFKPYSDDNSNI
jgi:hypothetical protein